MLLVLKRGERSFQFHLHLLGQRFFGCLRRESYRASQLQLTLSIDRQVCGVPEHLNENAILLKHPGFIKQTSRSKRSQDHLFQIESRGITGPSDLSGNLRRYRTCQDAPLSIRRGGQRDEVDEPPLADRCKFSVRLKANDVRQFIIGDRRNTQNSKLGSRTIHHDDGIAFSNFLFLQSFRDDVSHGHDFIRIVTARQVKGRDLLDGR